MSNAAAARVLIFALVGEGLLGLAGVVWILWRDLPISWGAWHPSLASGLTLALMLAAVQYGLLHHAPAIGPVRALRALYTDVLHPLFRDVTPLEIAGISLLAGVGEELFFRGAVQQEWGWVAASVLFGLCHVGSRDTLILGLWAALVGGLLGWLAMRSGGLIAPIVAHAVYDAMALSYIRWGIGPADPAGDHPDGSPADRI